MVKTWSTPVCTTGRELIPCANCGAGSGSAGGAIGGSNVTDGCFKPALDCGDFSYVRCAFCGLVQMNPQPVKNEVISRYAQMFGNDYLLYELANEASFLNLQQLALRDARFFELEKSLFSSGDLSLDLSPDAASAPAILDIGCATGALLSFLRSRGWRVTGVEISPCGEYARNERKLDVRSLPLEENNFVNDGFDAVLASHLIEHLNDPRSFLTETHRILKNEGRIFITTPNIGGFQARITGGGWRSAIFDHLYLFSARTLPQMLKSAGFAIEGWYTWGGLAAGLAPKMVKNVADFLAKRLNLGDVMIVRAKKQSCC